MSRLLDRWLPPVLLAVGLDLGRLARRLSATTPAARGSGSSAPRVFLLAFFASVFPFTRMGTRAARGKLNYELPPSPALRVDGHLRRARSRAGVRDVADPAAGASGLLIGRASSAAWSRCRVLFLLFRLLPREAPVTFGYATGSFLLSIVVAVAAVFALNLMLVGVLRATKTDLALAASPFGPA